MKKTLCWLDVETTGLSITKSRIVQIGTIKGEEEKNILINPEEPIPPETTAIHGITDEMVKDAPTFKQISASLLEYIGDNDLAGYNVTNFDIPMLMEEFVRAGMELDMDSRKVIDVYINECKINPRNLGAVYLRLTGRVLEDAHDALADTRATRDIYNIQMEMPDIEEILLEENEMEYLDFTRKIYINEHGENCWAFGKWKDKPLTIDLQYCHWVLRGDFTKQVKDIVRGVITGN